MSTGKTRGQALGGAAVILLTGALQISGYQSPFVAIVLAIIAFVLVIPFLNEKRKLAWDGGRKLYATHGARRPRQSMMIVILIGALIGGTGLGVVWWALQLSHFKSPPTAAKSGAEPPSTPATHSHRVTSNAAEIMGRINAAGPLQKEDVANGFVNGVVDWKLTFWKVKPVRGDSANVEVTFYAYRINRPLVTFLLPRKGNEYLGVLKGAPADNTNVFRVTGVISDIDYEHEEIKLRDASLEQLPPVKPLR